MGREDLGPIAQYNSLTDPYLQGYYSKSIIRNHLKQTGLINKRGEIIPDEIWRKRISTKERMEQASRIIANRIVQQAIEIKNLEKAELRRQMDVLTKKELVRRIRGKSAEDRNPPKLWPETSQSEDGAKKGVLINSTIKNDEYNAIRVVDDDEEYFKRYRTYAQRDKPKKRTRSKKRFQFKRSFSACPKKEPVSITVTMLYYGKGINIPFDTQIFEAKDEISVYQQHCGGENVQLFSGLVEAGKKFRFISRRHREYPFSLTIYINGTYDCRISTWHKLNARIGGPTGRFAITNVTGENPCIRCLLERDSIEKEKNKSKNKKEKIKVITQSNVDNKKTGSNETREIAVDHGDAKNESGLRYGSDFDDEDADKSESKNESWIVKVYTSDLKGKHFEGTDANVYLSLFDDDDEETEIIWLNKSNAVSKNSDLFEAGKMDEFILTPKADLTTLRKIKIGHDNTSYGSGWHLNKVEIRNKSSSKVFVFECNQWLAKNEGDGKTERILWATGRRDTNLQVDKPNVIEIPVRHLDDSDSDDYQSQQVTPKVEEIKRKGSDSSWSQTSVKEKVGREKIFETAEGKSKRFTNDDVIKEIKRNESISRLSSKSSARSSSTLTDSSRSISDRNKISEIKRATVDSKQSSRRSSQLSKDIVFKDELNDYTTTIKSPDPARLVNYQELAKNQDRRSSNSSKNSFYSDKNETKNSSSRTVKTADQSRFVYDQEKVQKEIDSIKKTQLVAKKIASGSSSDDEESLFESNVQKGKKSSKPPSQNGSRVESRTSSQKNGGIGSRTNTPKLDDNKTKAVTATVGRLTPNKANNKLDDSWDDDSNDYVETKAVEQKQKIAISNSRRSLKDDEISVTSKSKSSSKSSGHNTPTTSDKYTMPKLKITASSDVEQTSSRENLKNNLNKELELL